jgi:hypothetical protein
MRMRESLFTISCACVTLLCCAVSLYIGSGLLSEKCYNQGGWLFDFPTVSEGQRPCSKLVDFLGWFYRRFFTRSRLRILYNIVCVVFCSPAVVSFFNPRE